MLRNSMGGLDVWKGSMELQAALLQALEIVQPSLHSSIPTPSS